SPAASDSSALEQSGVHTADAAVRRALDEGNREYEQRFGHMFIVAAAGRSAPDIVVNLRDRLQNDPATELRTAAAEHRKITQLRLQRLIG
ncbi:MAG: 2-oxo-4-hydroxy-4-carboxy-5-ureidoimidazoline decarboxylase, partial [Vicinamibacterales bacterium]